MERPTQELQPKKDLGPIPLVVFNVLAIFVLSQFIAAILVQAAASFARIHTSIDDSAGAQFSYVVLAEGFAALSVLFLVKRRGLSLGTIGLGRTPKLSDAGRALIGFGLFYALLIIAAGVVGLFYPDLNKGDQDVGFNHLKTASDTLLAFFALVFLPPIGEETLVRGYLYSGLRGRMKYLPALIITSVLFGAAHLASGSDGVLWSAGLNTFVLSVVLVYLRESTGALYAGMLVHMFNNLIAFGVHFHI